MCILIMVCNQDHRSDSDMCIFVSGKHIIFKVSVNCYDSTDSDSDTDNIVVDLTAGNIPLFSISHSHIFICDWLRMQQGASQTQSSH